MVNEANLPLFPWGAVHDFLQTFDPDYELSKEQQKAEAQKEMLEIERRISIIKADEKWLRDIEKKAKENGISVDSMLYLDAKWLIDTEKQQSN